MNQQQQDRRAKLEEWKQQKVNRGPPTRVPSNQRLPQVRTNSDQKSSNLRSVLNQTGANFQNKPQGSIPKIGFANQKSGLQQRPVEKSRIEIEVDLIFKLYLQNFEIMERNVPEYQRRAHDFDKWKKKFFTVFNREKVIDFTHVPNAQVDAKNAKLDPESLTKSGKKILEESAKFWILYLNLLQAKITDQNRFSLREQLISNFKDNNDWLLIPKYLDSILRFSEIEDSFDKENQNPTPSFKEAPSQEEKQNETQEEIIDDAVREINMDEQEKEQKVKESQNAKEEGPSGQTTEYPTVTFTEQEPKNQEQDKQDMEIVQTNGDNYVVEAPIANEEPSSFYTPCFSKVEQYYNQEILQKQERSQKKEERDVQRCNQRLSTLTFNQSQPIQVQNQMPVFGHSTDQVQGEVQKQEQILPAIQLQIPQAIQEQERQEQVLVSQQEEIVKEKLENEEEMKQEDNQEQEDQKKQMEEDNEKMVCNQTVVVAGTPEIEQQQEFEIEQEEEQNFEKQNREEEEEKEDHQMDFEQMEEERGDESDMERSISQASVSKGNSKKRKRSESFTPTSMVLRSKNKKRKIEGQENPSFSVVMPQKNQSNSKLNGASYLRYDIIEKKDGRRSLVPVRYSIRNQEQDGPDTQLHRQIMNNELSFVYEPKELEGNFAMDKSSKQVKQFLKQKNCVVSLGDIREVIDADFGRKGVFSLIRIKPESIDNFNGHEYVATSLKRDSETPKNNSQVKKLIDKYLKGQNVKELMFAKLTEEAREFIKKSRR